MVEELVLVPVGANLPEKKYFKIGEASTLLGVKPHVLRYWETEFPQIRPYKSKTGQRLYRRRDVEALIKIQKLLYEERFTIAGARQALRLHWSSDETEKLPEQDMIVEESEDSTAMAPDDGSIKLVPEEASHVRDSLLRAKMELEAILSLTKDLSAKTE